MSRPRALLAGVLLFAYLATPALAAGHWSAPQRISDQALNVSCKSRAFCVAAGGGEFVRFDGHAWSAPLPLGTGSSVEAISCATRAFCMALDFAGGAQAYNGSGWSKEVHISNLLPTSVSCPTRWFCMAVAMANGDVPDEQQAVIYRHGRWGRSTTIDRANYMFSVSCSSPRFCVAVDYEGRAIIFRHSRWGRPRNVDPDGDGINSVSCPTAHFCVAVDLNGRAFTYNGRRWSRPRLIDRGPGLNTVSCPSRQFCVVVDTEGNALTFNGRGWSRRVHVIDEDPNNGLGSVSCTSASFCAAVDTKGFAATYTGGG